MCAKISTNQIKGMILWVKLIMFLLEDVYHAPDIQEIMRTLPDGLPAL